MHSRNEQTSFYLTRHGETDWNCLRKLQRQLDSPLTPRGIEQAHKISRHIEFNSIDCIVTSPIGRAFETARLCNKMMKKSMVVHQGLIERDFGDWQGKLFDELSSEENFESIFFRVTEDSPPSPPFWVRLNAATAQHQNGAPVCRVTFK